MLNKYGQVTLLGFTKQIDEICDYYADKGNYDLLKKQVSPRKTKAWIWENLTS